MTDALVIEVLSRLRLTAVLIGDALHHHARWASIQIRTQRHPGAITQPSL